ncbi:MAG: DUF2812 domain-containing protein [Oscillospiraceae bacterium]|nr:DUF2812 domain-containing protein [Oscillospiraceae bacterium]
MQEMQEMQVSKSFFSSVKECEWLNELGQEGYRLVGRREGKYRFEVEEGRTWYYSLEWLDCSPKSEKGQAYIRSREQGSVELAATFSLWAYFVSPDPIPASDEGRRRTAVHYRNIALLIYLFDIIAAALTGYHYVVRPFLAKQKVLLEAPVLKKSGNFLIDLARRLEYGAKELLYRYGRLFGETKAALALGILIPLVIGLSIAGAFWTAEWLKNRPEKTEPEEGKGEEAPDEQTEVSGETAERS